MQIIVGALAAGVLIFLGIVVFQAWLDERGPADNSLITYIAAGYAVFAVIASIIVPYVIAGSMRQSLIDPRTPTSPQTNDPGTGELADIGPLAQMYQTLLIIRAAIIEGAAFFCLVAYMLERQSIGLIIAAVLLLMLFALIPTLSRLESWVENELVNAEQLRQMR